MLISCRNIKKSFGDKVVLKGIDLNIERGDRIGLVGRNGAGKSTLADILTGNSTADAGTITSSRQRIKVGYLRQTEDAENFRDIMINEIDMSGELQRLTSHLGVSDLNDLQEEQLAQISGGEKTKLALAAVWAAQPDLAILDEPTNHMDYQGMEYLIQELQRFDGAVIIISHDRYFLDKTVTQIAEIEKGKITMYPGNYSDFRAAKQQLRESQWHLYKSQQKEQRKIDQAIEQLKTWSDKAHRESRHKGGGMVGGKEYFRKKAKKRDQAIKSQLKRLEKMRQEQVERPAADPRVKLHMNSTPKGSRRVLEADSISKAYGNRTLFTDSSFYINRGEKVGIFGPNGCGKTTLVRIILGQEELDEGQLFVSSSAKLAYVSQELPQEEPESFLDLIRNWPPAKQKQIIQLMIALGLSYDLFHVALGQLSRGERMKIAMGLAIWGENDLLILDEPTNHLDVYSREALEESLLQYAGTILLISHDRYLLDKVCDHMLVFEQQHIQRVEGQLTDYLSRKLGNKKADPATDGAEERLILETRISRVLSELSLLTPDRPEYAALDEEYQELLRQRSKLMQESRT
jgi:macrolide transport system ATP-binding/permease protein